jgi:hypothetical protein
MPETTDATALLRQPDQPQTVALDVFTIRVPIGDPALDDSLWSDVDEQRFPAAVRKRLAANGIRAGVVSSQWPARLQSALKLDEAAAPTANEPNIEITVSDFEQQAKVRHRIVNMPSGRRAQLICLGEKARPAELPLFIRDDEGAVVGRTYRKACGMLVVRAVPQGDRSIKLELTPEVEHGDPTRRVEPGDGMLRVEFSPAHDRFDALKMDSNLALGQMLVITCMDDRPGTLGHHYFTETNADRVLQKLMLIRLSQSDYDDLFGVAIPSGE